MVLYVFLGFNPSFWSFSLSHSLCYIILPSGICSMFTHKVWTSAVVRAQWGTLLWKFSSWQGRTPVKLCRWVTCCDCGVSKKMKSSHKEQLEAVKYYTVWCILGKVNIFRLVLCTERRKVLLHSVSYSKVFVLWLIYFCYWISNVGAH